MPKRRERKGNNDLQITTQKTNDISYIIPKEGKEKVTMIYKLLHRKLTIEQHVAH
jgi:hypothetical protein